MSGPTIKSSFHVVDQWGNSIKIRDAEDDSGRLELIIPNTFTDTGTTDIAYLPKCVALKLAEALIRAAKE